MNREEIREAFTLEQMEQACDQNDQVCLAVEEGIAEMLRIAPIPSGFGLTEKEFKSNALALVAVRYCVVNEIGPDMFMDSFVDQLAKLLLAFVEDGPV